LANRPIIWKPLPGLPHIKIVIAFIANYRTSKHARFRVERCDGRHKLGFEYPIIFWTPWARSALLNLPRPLMVGAFSVHG
jgi:hypothetical protein